MLSGGVFKFGTGWGNNLLKCVLTFGRTCEDLSLSTCEDLSLSSGFAGPLILP